MSEPAVTRQDERPDNRTPGGKGYASRVDEMLDGAGPSVKPHAKQPGFGPGVGCL